MDKKLKIKPTEVNVIHIGYKLI